MDNIPKLWISPGGELLLRTSTTPPTETSPRVVNKFTDENSAGYLGQLLFDQRGMNIGPSLGLVAQGLLSHQPRQQVPGGLGMPAMVGCDQVLDDFVGGDGMPIPDDAHDLPFGITDSRRGFHDNLAYRCNLD